MKKQRSVKICTGGGGPALPAKVGIEGIECSLSSRTARASRGTKRKPRFSRCRFTRVEQDSFGICPKIPEVRNVGQTLNQVQGDKFLSLRIGFTMAEILLSLTIIGVVAAITLPSLTGNINERTWNTQRKALYARFSQAIALMPSLNGYGTLTEDSSSGASDAVDTAAETFITDGLAKVLKINNICDSDHLEDCGIVSSINTTSSAVDLPLDWLELNSKMINASYAGLSLDSHSMINAKAAAFETQNGESLVVYYNPSCRGAEERLTAYIVSPLICANFIYDLNGSKGPNTVGKDVGFITALYSFDSNVVSPMPVYQTKTGYYDDAVKFCREQDNARLPNKEEAISLWVNKKFIPNISTMQFYTSSSPGSANRIIQLDGNAGVMGSVFKDETADISAQCVKR